MKYRLTKIDKAVKAQGTLKRNYKAISVEYGSTVYQLDTINDFCDFVLMAKPEPFFLSDTASRAGLMSIFFCDELTPQQQVNAIMEYYNLYSTNWKDRPIFWPKNAVN
jgi:hypothetical protein